MLVKGLKKKFEIYAPVFLPKLLEKFKEKKQNVILPLRDAVDAIYLCVNYTFKCCHLILLIIYYTYFR